MGCGTDFSKCLVFAFNFLFALGGLSLVVLGAIGTQHQDMIEYKDAVSPYFLIGLGCAIFLISCLGCCGVYQESPCMLRTLGALLVIVLLVLLTVGTLALLARDPIEKATTNFMEDKMSNYTATGKEGEAARTYWDSIQSKGCCGVRGPNDWQEIVDHTPDSCRCNVTDGEDSNNCKDHIYQHGCGELINILIMFVIAVVASLVFFLSFLLVIGAIFVCCLATKFSNRQRMTLR